MLLSSSSPAAEFRPNKERANNLESGFWTTISNECTQAHAPRLCSVQENVAKTARDEAQQSKAKKGISEVLQFCLCCDLFIQQQTQWKQHKLLCFYVVKNNTFWHVSLCEILRQFEQKVQLKLQASNQHFRTLIIDSVCPWRLVFTKRSLCARTGTSTLTSGFDPMPVRIQFLSKAFRYSC